MTKRKKLVTKNIIVSLSFCLLYCNGLRRIILKERLKTHITHGDVSPIESVNTKFFILFYCELEVFPAPIESMNTKYFILFYCEQKCLSSIECIKIMLLHTNGLART